MGNRTNDVEIELADKVAKANASKAEIAVSFHSNAGGGDGFEVYYYSSSDKGKKLAGLCEKYVEQIGQNSRGLKVGDHLYFIRNTTMPAVLVESYFLDHKTDVQMGNSKEKQEAFGVAYAKAILDYLGIAWKQPEVKGIYKVQVGAFSLRSNAEALKQDLEEKGYKAFIKEEK